MRIWRHMTDEEVRALYLTGKWNKQELYTLKGIPQKQVSRATKGLTRERIDPFFKYSDIEFKGKVIEK